MIRLGSMAMAQEAMTAGPRLTLRKGQCPEMSSYASCAGTPPQLRRQRRRRGAGRKLASPGAIYDVGEIANNEDMKMDATSKSMGTGCSLALTSPRQLLPRRACIPVAPRTRTANSSPEPPSYDDWLREGVEEPSIDITTKDVPFDNGHCNADLLRKHDTKVIEKTDADTTDAETAIGVYGCMKGGNADQVIDYSRLQENQCQRIPHTSSGLRTSMIEGTTISEIEGRALMNTGSCIGK